MPNVLSPRDLVSKPDNMDETVLYTNQIELNQSAVQLHENSCSVLKSKIGKLKSLSRQRIKKHPYINAQADLSLCFSIWFWYRHLLFIYPFP